MSSKERVGVYLKRLDIFVDLKSKGAVKLSYDQRIAVLQHVLRLKINDVFFCLARQGLSGRIAYPYLIPSIQQLVQIPPARLQGAIHRPGALEVERLFVLHLAELDFENW